MSSRADWGKRERLWVCVGVGVWGGQVLCKKDMIIFKRQQNEEMYAWTK